MEITNLKTIASESQHWYKANGDPCYTVLARNGEPRATTVRDARKLGLVASVTSITKLLAKPGLELWKARQVYEVAFTTPRNAGETDESHFDRCMIESGERARKAAERGTALHADIERAIQGKQHGHTNHVAAVANALCTIGIDLYAGEAERSFACESGYGGKVDYHSQSAVVDFKSKDRIEDGKKLAHDEHCLQLSAYRFGLGLPETARLVNVFVGIDDCRAVVVEHSQEDAVVALQKFKMLLAYFKLEKGL